MFGVLGVKFCPCPIVVPTWILSGINCGSFTLVKVRADLNANNALNSQASLTIGRILLHWSDISPIYYDAYTLAFSSPEALLLRLDFMREFMRLGTR